MSDSSHDRHVGRFDRWAETYDESVLQRLLFGPLQRSVVELAADAVAAPRSILDVGCGTGRLLRCLAERFPGADLTGVDASGEMIATARAALGEVGRATFVQGYAEHLPFGDASFDLVTTTMSFHHWADQPAALLEISRVLVPGGAFLLADALPTGWWRWVFAHDGHGTFCAPAQLGEMLAEAGMRVEGAHRVRGFGGTIQTFVSRMPVAREGG